MEKTKDVFLFWIGNPEKISKLVNDIKANGLNPVVGPSKEDHDYLYKNFKFYKNSYDMKIWAYCSDVWRFFILSRNDGMYIDTSVEIGPNFLEFFRKSQIKKYYFVKEQKYVLSSAILVSNGGKIIFEAALNTYKELPDINPHLFFISPYVLSRVVHNYSKYSLDWEIFQNDDIFIDILPSIRDKNTIVKKGSHSWVPDFYNTKIDNFDIFSSLQKNWENKYFPKGTRKLHKYSSSGECNINIIAIRNFFDRKIISRKYSKNTIKMIDYRIKFQDLFFWSDLYIFFKNLFK